MENDDPSLDDPTISDEESRAAMRAFLQRSEVRLSTIHRVGQALLGGSALVLLLPLFLRDAFPKMMTVITSSYDANQPWLPMVGIGIAASLVILLPIPAIFLMFGDLLGFYFTSNTFGAAPSKAGSDDERVVFNPRFILPGLGFNHDELSPRTREALAAGRNDEWTRALLVPRSDDDRGWRDRFDTRTFEVWGVMADEGHEGDSERMRQAFRLAGLHRDRTLALDVARTEALIAKHVLVIRTVVLRYCKALLLLIATTVVTLAASGVVDQAIREDPDGGRFVSGFPDRSLFLVALVYVLWAPLAARSVTAPLRMIQRHTPGVGEHRDVYRDKFTTQFESAMILVTFVVLVTAGTTMVLAGYAAARGTGLAIGLGLAAAGTAVWVASLRDYRGNARDTVDAVRMFATGHTAPKPSEAMRRERAARREPS